MRAVISPSTIGVDGGQPLLYEAPPSKSYFQRLCAAALLWRGIAIFPNSGRSEDDAAALRIIEELGAKVERHGNRVTITSEGVKPRSGVVHCGESGLSARLFAPIAALSSTRVEIQGEGSLTSRPMDAVVEALRALNVTASSNDGYLPIVVQGPLKPGSIVIDGTTSSQVISGLLFALAASIVDDGLVTLRAKGLVSQPYIAMSCDVLRHFDFDARFDGDETCFIGGRRGLGPSYTLEIDTEMDWSSAAAIAIAASFGGSGIEINDLAKETHADAVILDILVQAGARVEVVERDIRSTIRPGSLRAFAYDCTNSPDLVPILSILATACKGESRISGLHRLTHKESDRTKTTSALLAGLGIDHSIEDDAFVIAGPQTPRASTIGGQNDHRIVMAAAIAALRADGPVTIEGAEAVRKSYPDFFADLQKLGVKLELHS
jgi:3-phosphoshikimate 1-carboxyvinyltransferase